MVVVDDDDDDDDDDDEEEEEEEEEEVVEEEAEEAEEEEDEEDEEEEEDLFVTESTLCLAFFSFLLSRFSLLASFAASADLFFLSLVLMAFLLHFPLSQFQ